MIPSFYAPLNCVIVFCFSNLCVYQRCNSLTRFSRKTWHPVARQLLVSQRGYKYFTDSPMVSLQVVYLSDSSSDIHHILISKGDRKSKAVFDVPVLIGLRLSKTTTKQLSTIKICSREIVQDLRLSQRRAVVMRSSVFSDIMPSSPLNVNRRFEEHVSSVLRVEE